MVGELRDYVFRLSVVAGVVAALFWGLHHTPEPKKCPTAGHAQHALAQCVTRTLGHVLLDWGFILAAGMLAGCLLGLLLARSIPMPRAASARPKPRA